jgi:hypothetical protein
MLPRPMKIPDERAKLLSFASELVEQCRISVHARAAYCRWISMIVAMGRDSARKSLINLMYNHLDRYSAHLFSPISLHFTMDFDNEYPPDHLKRAAVVGRAITKHWKKSNTDMMFGQGVFEAGKFGSCFLKQWVEQEGEDGTPVLQKRLVMPWQFGVYREDESELDKQSALCETIYMTLPEVWRRIYHLPNAKSLFERIKTHAAKGTATDDYNSFVHQVLSTSVLQTAGAPIPRSGGIVSVTSDAGYAVIGAELGVDIVKMHELWVQGEEDYVTIQLIEPDIIVAPLYKKSNLLIPGDMHTGLHPYVLIQPNPRAGYIWGKPEIEELIEPQGFLSVLADDTKKISGLQIDKILGLVGYEGDPAEYRDQMHDSGYVNTMMGGSITDLTPKMPETQLPLMKAMIEFINMIGGMPPVMQGQGEQGVRTGVHADTLVKTGSPRLRDASLLVERQCAQSADLTYQLKRAKEERNYWTDGSSLAAIDKSTFKLTDIPDDGTVSVDSHSGSPIFADDLAQLIGFGMKAGFVPPEYAIDNLPFPAKDTLKAELKEKQEKQQQFLAKLKQEDPEAYSKLIEKQGSAGHHK